MSLEYSITYKAENTYENLVCEAHWQFLIIPQQNETQKFLDIDFSNSIGAINEYSVNGYGFDTIRVRPRQKFSQISFEANFKLIKTEVNPFDFKPEANLGKGFKKLRELGFKVGFEAYLSATHFTTIPNKNHDIFLFDERRSIFDNLLALNEWTYIHLFFKTGVTDVYTTLDEIIEKRHGVCQDFTHLFCSLARKNGVPSRYVSGYLHQGNGFFGDSQMHAWAEAYIPNIGWVGFDPTNNLIATVNHIKVAHGRDYNDCSPLKGVVHTSGRNETMHSVLVSGQQQQ